LMSPRNHINEVWLDEFDERSDMEEFSCPIPITGKSSNT
jgi:hypothetical protein